MNLFISKAILPKFVKKAINILFYRGYSGNLKEYSFDRKIARSSSNVLISGIIENNGWQKNLTTYLIFKIIDPYEPKKEIFNSDLALSFNEKRNLILSDIPRNKGKRFAFTWEIPSEIEIPSLYIKIDVWSPRKLYRKRNLFYYPFLFDTSGWKGFVELIKIDRKNKVLKIFFSYAWLNESHKKWVLNLADLLSKHGFDTLIDRDLLPGQEITKFMEKGIVDADIILLICSDQYTQKANNRVGGAGYETVLATKKYYSSKNKDKFIPIIRDNSLPSSKKIPEYLGSTLYVDMDHENWEGEPLQKLLQAIRNHVNKEFD